MAVSSLKITADDLAAFDEALADLDFGDVSPSVVTPPHLLHL